MSEPVFDDDCNRIESSRSRAEEALALLRPASGGDGSVTLSSTHRHAVARAITAVQAGEDCAADRLHMAFLVLSDSGHGGAICEVRRWFKAGAAGPIPWPGGALFKAWAEENGIVERAGYMARR